MFAVVIRRARVCVAVTVVACLVVAIYLRPRRETIVEPVLVPAPVALPADSPPPPRGSVTLGSCDDTPPLFRHPTSEADAAALAALIARWVAGDDAPIIDARACGAESVWLRAALRDELAHTDVLCEGNVCCYFGVEYEHSGTVSFRKTDAGWTLDAWAQDYQGSDTDGSDDQDLDSLTPALQRLAKRACPGAPAAFY